MKVPCIDLYKLAVGVVEQQRAETATLAAHAACGWLCLHAGQHSQSEPQSCDKPCRCCCPDSARVPAGDAKPRPGKVAELFVYDNFNRVPVQRVEAGDICAFSGLSDACIGETINSPDNINPLPTIAVSLLGLPPHWADMLIQHADLFLQTVRTGCCACTALRKAWLRLTCQQGTGSRAGGA